LTSNKILGRLGLCGIELEVTVWKSGSNVKCPHTGSGFTRYPHGTNPDPGRHVKDFLKECKDCPENVHKGERAKEAPLHE